MRKISGNVVWTKPMSLPKAAKLLSRFSAVDNGSSGPVSLYLQRASEAFNHLVQFHNKRGKMDDLEQKPITPSLAEANTGVDEKPSAIDNVAEVEKNASKSEEQEKGTKKKKRQEKETKKTTKKKRIVEVDSNNKRDRKKRRIEDVDL